MKAAIGLSLAVVLAAAAPADVMAPESGDMVMGREHAPVTVIEYASVGCPHCAAWDAEVFPTLKARYIDSGRVRFVLREMPNGTIKGLRRTRASPGDAPSPFPSSTS
jgi:protein-disulfide isomerase